MAIILSFYHSIILSFYHSIILSFYHSIKQSSNQAIKQSSNQAIKQHYHTFITFYPFTKTYLKIPYFLLFSLLLTLLLTHTAFFNHLIR
ncbi:hypothetical protein [Helicobacter pylori]|uniref:hypothetical protein n=1 Tax=Helicobacter pylori TaxID=210 RepID=UPI00026A2500|nr:hypothetical protein [Helicobacter pylori]EJB67739.1 hypothetical protein HPHPA6_1536 [Helicobacter pylori Hp A-6]